MPRTWSALAATAALLVAALAGGPAAVASTGTAGAAPARAAGDKPVRDLHDSIVKRHGRLYFTGRVDPGHGPVVIQKKACAKKRCRWQRFTRVTTHGPKERWRVRVPAPRHGNWYWRGYVRAYGGYSKSWTHVWKTYVTHF